MGPHYSHGNDSHSNDSHIADGELLLTAGGELGAARADAIRRHLAVCPLCRIRNAELAETLATVIEAQRRELDAQLPPMDDSRRVLQARLAEAAQTPGSGAWGGHWMAWAAGVLLIAGTGAMLSGWPGRGATAAEFAPNPVRTPGAVRLLSREAVCSNGDRQEPAPAISAAVAREVFRRYGIHNPRPRTYEVDYLIPPALGGSLDARNLWPQPYSAGVWNARVKDALEDRLRVMVCEGKVDLATAQRDLARDWIAAYKKYFHVRTPLPDHVAFVKDRPWE